MSLDILISNLRYESDESIIFFLLKDNSSISIVKDGSKHVIFLNFLSESGVKFCYISLLLEYLFLTVKSVIFKFLELFQIKRKKRLTHYFRIFIFDIF